MPEQYMPARRTLLVGSMPCDNEEAAMKLALQHLGDSLLCLPDGEIGEKSATYPQGKRAAWVMATVIRCMEDTANWAVVKKGVMGPNGFPTSIRQVPKLKPKHSPAAMEQHLEFGYDMGFAHSYPVFCRLRHDKHLPHLKFQVGVPTGLAIAIGMLTPLNVLRYTAAFTRRLAREVNDILKTANDDVIIQIEVPMELILAYHLPRFLLAFSVRSVLGLLAQMNPATVGIHLCFGDLNNRAAIHAKTLQTMVAFSNVLVPNIPAKHRLAYVHYPLAEGAIPPVTDPGYYTPLKDIRLPQGTHFVAGIVHEKHATAQTQQLLSVIQNLRGTTVAVAASCGLGRRSPSTAQTIIEQMAALSAAVR